MRFYLKQVKYFDFKLKRMYISSLECSIYLYVVLHYIKKNAVEINDASVIKLDAICNYDVYLNIICHLQK